MIVKIAIIKFIITIMLILLIIHFLIFKFQV